MSLTEQMEQIRKALGVAQANLFNVHSSLHHLNPTAEEERELQELLANAPVLANRVAFLTSRVAQKLQR